jgi:hypothetical protein
MSIPADADWSDRARTALAGYSEPLLRSVAARLVKPRANQPVEDVLDKLVAAQTNAPVIDRRVRELPPECRKLLALIGLSRQQRWKVAHLITLLAALDHAEGFAPVQALLETGLLFPDWGDAPLDDFAAVASGVVFAHPAVSARARGEDLGLPDLAVEPPTGAVRVSDGLEWPLRLAVLWQSVGAAPVRVTQASTLFKRDQTRLQTDPLLSAAPADSFAPVPDAGVLALYWASAVGLLAHAEDELRAERVGEWWGTALAPLQIRLFAALPLVESWDALAGYAPSDTGLSQTPTVGFLCLLLLRQGWVDPADAAAWLWSHHPSWAGTLPAAAEKDRGAGWVKGFYGVAYMLGLIEASGTPPAQPVPRLGNGRGVGDELVRLSPLGRHLLAGEPEPSPPPAFPQTLMVQPNAEVLAYRQGLTPALVMGLSRFATWKGIGPACTLELNPEQTYRGLESGLTSADIVQTLNRHGMRPVPAAVADLLQRWANKRERITVYSSAVLVEFPSPADLDAAVSRGIVSVKLTDRVGMTGDGKEPSMSQLRQTGNRDYEAKPQKCVTVGDDGVTLTIDAAQADLLLEAEIARFAEPLASDIPSVRRFRLTPPSLRRALDQGMAVADIDTWFVDRTGASLSPAGRLFLVGPVLPPPAVGVRLVVEFANADVTDGVMQWPDTRSLVAQRLGPLAVAVDEANLEAFRAALQEVGVTIG